MRAINSDLLGELSQWVGRTSALSFPPDLYRELEARMLLAARESGHSELEPFIHQILDGSSGPPQNQSWLRHLTVGETYFWREPQSFEALEQTVIPLLVRARSGVRKLAFWSAGCSSGEEAYSLAIALTRAAPDLAGWQIRILATDLNEASLEKARAGRYKAWSFRNAPEWFRKDYFTTMSASQWEIRPEIRQMVEFRTQNLATSSDWIDRLVEGFDLILCRNVLMYFSVDRTETILEEFGRCLNPDGWLLVSASELSLAGLGSFRSEVVSETYFHKKKVRSQKTDSPDQEVPNRPPLRRVVSPPRKVPKPIPDLASIRALADQGCWSEAMEQTRDYIGRDRLNASALYLQAVIFQEMQQTEEAIDALKHALSVDPSNALASFALGHILRTRGLGEQALRWFGNALESAESKNAEDIVPGSENLTFGAFRVLVQTALRMGGRS